MPDLRALIRRRRATRPKQRRIPRQAYPENIEREYARTLIDMMQSVHRRVMREVLPAFAGDAATHGVNLGPIRADVFRSISRKRAGLLAQGIGKKVQRFTDGAIDRQIKAVIGVSPFASVPSLSPDLLRDFAANNANLIRTIPERYFDQVDALVQESFLTGRRAADVSTRLQERFDVSKSNANRIARDQIGKLNGQITHERQTALGIDAYIWRTSLDDRVRDPEHTRLEGQRFTWESGGDPTEGHPGDAIQCRCRAEPDLSKLLGS